MRNRPLFQQDVSLLLESDLLDRQHYLKAYSGAASLVSSIEHHAAEGAYEFLEDPFLFLEDFSEVLEKTVQRFKKFRMVFVIGKHASLLSMQSLTAIFQSWVWIEDSKPRLCFLDHLDPENFWELMSIATPQTTGVIVIANSEEFEFILLQFMRCIEYWKDILSPETLKDHFLVVLPNKTSVFHAIVESFQFQSLEYKTPFNALSCFSLPVLLPTIIGGFDAKKFNQGAALTCSQFFRRELKTPLEGMSLIYTAQKTYGPTNHVLHPIHQALHACMQWMGHVWYKHFQLTSMPYTILYESVHQKRHFFTVFFERQMARESLNPKIWQDIPEVKSFVHTSLVDGVYRDHQAFCQQQIQQGNLLRVININTLNEETLGAIMMNHILESLVMSYLFRKYPL